MTERHVIERTYRRKNILPKNMEKTTFDRKGIWPKLQMIAKVDHKPITLYDIWLPNRLSNDTISKAGNRCMVIW